MPIDQQFYVGQKALINKGGKILIVRDPRMTPDRQIELPGGKIQEGENDFTQSLSREIKEETSLKISVGNPFYISYFDFPQIKDHPNAGKKIFLVFFDCIYSSGEVTLSEEHNWYKWVGRDEFQQYFLKKNNMFEAIEKFFLLHHDQTR